MLSTSYEAIEFCNCGCDIINAVINCKALEARSSHIEFQYHVDFHEPTNLKPVDICAVLANQIENALEACEKIEDPDKRIVRVEIRQRNGFALFKVMNTVRENPFRYEDKLLTTKTDTSRMHGLGLKNISDIARKVQRFDANKISRRDVYFDGPALLFARIIHKILQFRQKPCFLMQKLV